MKSIMIFLTTLIAATSSSFSEDTFGKRFVYKTVEDRELKLYVSTPADWKETDRRPALVFFHGGGWVGGKPSLFNEHAKYFTSRGLVCVLVEYRLLKKGEKRAPLECVQDAKSSMRWVRASAEKFGIDPQRIGAAGGSAGGHLAAFLGLMDGKDDPRDDLSVSAKANALVLFNPVFNNGPGNYAFDRIGPDYKAFSPAHNITSNAPPTVIFLGTEDHLIPVKTVTDFQNEMKAKGVRCDVHLYEGAKHGFYGRANPKYLHLTVFAADEFLSSIGWLKGPPTLPREAPKKTEKPQEN